MKKFSFANMLKYCAFIGGDCDNCQCFEICNGVKDFVEIPNEFMYFEQAERLDQAIKKYEERE